MRVGCGPDVLGVVDPVPIVIKAGAGAAADGDDSIPVNRRLANLAADFGHG
jgi:hypothetical protein